MEIPRELIVKAYYHSAQILVKKKGEPNDAYKEVETPRWHWLVEDYTIGPRLKDGSLFEDVLDVVGFSSTKIVSPLSGYPMVNGVILPNYIMASTTPPYVHLSRMTLNDFRMYHKIYESCLKYQKDIE